MADDHGSTYSQGLDVPMLSVVAAIGAILTYISVIGVQAYYDMGLRSQEQIKLIDPVYEPLENLQNQQKADLAKVHWVDREAGIAAVPIEQGMAQVITQYNNSKTSR